MPLEVWDSRTDVRNIVITPQLRSRIMRFEVGQVAPGHTHDVGHEMFLVLDGQAEFTIAGESAVLGPGQACVALAGQMHQVRTVGDRPMTLYLSVTPHVEPTHTHWAAEGGARLPYRYGNATRAERLSRAEPAVLLERHVQESEALAQAAQANAAAQATAARDLAAALATKDAAATHAAVDAMWAAFYALHRQLQASQEAWNELAPAVADDD